MKKEFKKELANSIELNRSSLFYLLVKKPFRVVKFILFTRLTKVFKFHLKWKAGLFTGDKIMGIFPDPVFSFIYLYGYSEEAITNFMIRYLKPGMTFVDIGAHIGYESFIASRLVGSSGQVYSFEPTPSTYSLLVHNFSHLDNVHTYPFAVWSSNSTIEFLDYGHTYSGNNSFTEARLPKNILKNIKPQKRLVKAVSFDSFSEIVKIIPDFIKIDAESAEYNILIGMKSVLKKYSPAVVIEIGDQETDEKMGTEKCIRYLKSLGYLPYEYKDNKIVRFKERENYLSLYENVIFLPK